MINIQNINDNECFKWCSVRYLNPADCILARVTIADKDFSKRIDFKDIKFPERIPLALVLLVMKVKKIIQSIYLKNSVKTNILIYY